LPVTMFTDTMYSTLPSRKKNKAAQIFGTDFGFVRAFPMKKENQAHEALSLLFQWDGVSNVMVMDGSKAQVEGGLRRTLRDTGCHIKQTEPHTQSYNMGEGGVHLFRDDCIIREAYVRSHSSLDILFLEGQVPERKVKGKTVDFSTITEYAWYEWVKLYDTAANFPVSKIQLGRYLGAAICIGPTMARKILKNNRSLIYRTSVRPHPR
jgi:hypothetical protein